MAKRISLGVETAGVRCAFPVDAQLHGSSIHQPKNRGRFVYRYFAAGGNDVEILRTCSRVRCSGRSHGRLDVSYGIPASAANEDCTFTLDYPHASHHSGRLVASSAATIRCGEAKNYLGITVELFWHTPVAERVALGQNGNNSGTASFYRLAAAWDRCLNGAVMSAKASYVVIDKAERVRQETRSTPLVTVNNCA